MGQKTTTMRLRSVRFKSGAEVRVFRPKTDFKVRDNFRTAAHRIGSNDCADSMAGWAIVCWTRDGRVTVNFENGNESPVPGGGVSRYCGDVLAAELAVRWSRE